MDNYQKICNETRKIYPSLELDSVIKDIRKAVGLMGIHTRESDMRYLPPIFGFIRGCVFIEKGNPVIFINATLEPNAKRYVIAELLGYILLYLPTDNVDPNHAYYLELDESNKENVKINETLYHFAAELLAPTEQVYSDFLSYGKLDYNAIDTIAAKYKAPKQTITNSIKKYLDQKSGGDNHDV